MPGSTPMFLGRWTLLAALLLGLAVLIAHEVSTRRAYGGSLAALSTVTDDTLPTLLHLSELRRVVLDLDLELALQQDLEPARLRLRVERSWPVIDAHVEAYTAIPALPDERPLRAHLLQAVQSLRTAERDLFAATTERDARRAFREQVVPAAAEVRTLADAIVTLNARAAADAADEVLHAHERASDFSRLLLGAMVLVVAVSGAAAYAALARAERTARTTVDELDAFTGRVAHDLKGPLQPATLACEVLRREEGLTPAGARALERLGRSLQRAEGLIDGLLAFARAGARRDPAARTAVDEVTLELAPAWRLLAEQEAATLDVVVEPRARVAASQAVVASILDNLTRNALLHLGAARLRKVELRARAVGAVVELEVSDTGPGIPADLQGRLFRPFERGSDRPGGSGLGLATVKRLVDAHGGSIEVASRLGEGSTFRVRLPAAV